MGHGSFVCDVTALDEAAGLIAAILVARHGPERGDYDVEVRRAGERMALIGVAEGIRVRALLDAGRAEGVLGTSLVQLRDALRPMCGAVEQRGGQDREPAQLWWDEGAVRLGGCGGTRRLEARRVSARAGGGRRAARVADAAAEQFAAVLDAAWSASADGEVWFEALAGVIRFGGANGRRATVASAPADAKGRGGRVVVDGARLRSLVYWAGPDSGRVTVDVAAVDGVPFVTVRRGELEACFEGRWERSDVPRLMRPLDEPIVADRDPLASRRHTAGSTPASSRRRSTRSRARRSRCVAAATPTGRWSPRRATAGPTRGGTW